MEETNQIIEKLKISFGIISTFEDINRLKTMIQSVHDQNIPDYEIIVCGGHDDRIKNELESCNIKLINFNERQRCLGPPVPGWITRKKNIIFHSMVHDTIVMMHDYISLHNDWYTGLCRYISEDQNWCALCNTILKMNNKRWRLDWVSNKQYWTSYDTTFESDKKIYVSGSYFITKRAIMEKCLLNERLCAHQSEDVDWTNRIIKLAPIRYNPYSTCSLLKLHRENGDPN